MQSETRIACTYSMILDDDNGVLSPSKGTMGMVPPPPVYHPPILARPSISDPVAVCMLVVGLQIRRLFALLREPPGAVPETSVGGSSGKDAL